MLLLLEIDVSNDQNFAKRNVPYFLFLLGKKNKKKKEKNKVLDRSNKIFCISLIYFALSHTYNDSAMRNFRFRINFYTLHLCKYNKILIYKFANKIKLWKIFENFDKRPLFSNNIQILCIENLGAEFSYRKLRLK